MSFPLSWKNRPQGWQKDTAPERFKSNFSSSIDDANVNLYIYTVLSFVDIHGPGLITRPWLELNWLHGF